MNGRQQHVEVVESYRHFKPPGWVRDAVVRLLDSVPEEDLGGLKTVVLTDAAGLSHDRRRAKTKSRRKRVAISQSGGLYHQKWKGEPAWIELFVDNLLSGGPQILLRVALVRDIALGETLYHEIGHHIHATKRPEHKEPEDVADRWADRLLLAHIHKRYWYLRPVLLVAAICLRPFRAKLKVWTRRIAR